MCFGHSSSAPAPAPTTTPGVIDTTPPTPDYSQAYKYRGTDVGPNTTGRSGGTLVLDAASKAPKQNLGS